IYRKNIKGHIFDNSLQYYHSIIDEDGAIYMQLEHNFDIKHCAYQTDMDEMSDTALVITPTKGIGVTPIKVAPAYHSPPFGPTPIHVIKTTPLTKTAPVKTIALSGYPSSK
ncbi:MAG TPA: hypothetical protein VHA52_02815, partial [Candidatus Babeliaceae bacterium]|nr:hypothetical protein [Candidatus Babeliaceae bacterium]